MKLTYPKVSIITPAYKRIDYLAETIESAISQTFTDFELIVCDDSNDPKIKALCHQYKDPRIIYQANAQNLGIAMNIFKGIQSAHSDLIAKLDDDDRWTPTFLAKLMPVILSNPDICLVFSDHWIIDSRGEIMIEASQQQTKKFGRNLLSHGVVKQPKKLILNKSIPLASSAIFRKSAIDWSDYSEKVGGAYDWFLSSCLVSSGKSIFYIPEKLTEYRIHYDSGTSTKQLQNSLDTLFVSDKILHNPYFKELALEFKKMSSYNSKKAGNAYLKQKKIIYAFVHYFKSINYYIC